MAAGGGGSRGHGIVSHDLRIRLSPDEMDEAGAAGPAAELAGSFGGSVDTRYAWEDKERLGPTGDVVKGTLLTTQEPVIRKRTQFLQSGQGVPYHVVREVSILKGINHPHIVRLLDVIHEFDSVSLIYECLPRDLRSILDEKNPRFEPGPAIDPRQLKDYFRQMLTGVTFLHSQCILHRDLKPNDLRVTEDNTVKITNFRLARTFTLPLRTYTHEVVTLWYRAPEILLGKKRYDTSVDMWSAGCLLAEVTSGEALFRGDSEIDQLFQIFRVLGTPTKAEWPELKQLPDYKASFPIWEQQVLPKVVPGLDKPAEALLRKLLVYDSSERLRARHTLQHEYFDDLEGWVPPKVRPPPCAEKAAIPAPADAAP
mmetsp:Transcript_24614/g.64155  ORF Transcript_24614/g.64155 Transcript_24614/m.64155 type:complete len:369 (-) Transcript_24614:2863-3969(-)